LLLAAKDNQIKLTSAQPVVFLIPYSCKNRESATKGWFNQTRLVSLENMKVWEELKGIAAANKFAWGFAYNMLDADSEVRKSLVQKILTPLEDLWKRENERRERVKFEPLKPLPRIEVFVSLKFTQVGWGYFDAMTQWGF
jgi:hypothetical protein